MPIRDSGHKDWVILSCRHAYLSNFLFFSIFFQYLSTNFLYFYFNITRVGSPFNQITHILMISHHRYHAYWTIVIVLWNWTVHAKPHEECIQVPFQSKCDFQPFRLCHTVILIKICPAFFTQLLNSSLTLAPRSNGGFTNLYKFKVGIFAELPVSLALYIVKFILFDYRVSSVMININNTRWQNSPMTDIAE